MKNKTFKIAATVSAITLASSTMAADFSWYKIKDDMVDAPLYKTESINTPEKRAEKTQDRIMEQYNVYTEKKSVRDVVEEREDLGLKVGVEMNSHPSYENTVTYDTVDVNNNPVTVPITTPHQSSNFAITLRGNMNMTDFGMPGGRFTTKVALGNEHIDMDVNKPLLKAGGLSASAGLGLKVVHKVSPAWEEGFHPYANASVDFEYGNFEASVGARMMMDKPSQYDSGVIPYVGISYKF